MGTIETVEQLNQQMADAFFLFENDCLKDDAIRMIMSQLQLDKVGIIWNSNTIKGNWNEFYRTVERISWLPFSGVTLIRGNYQINMNTFFKPEPIDIIARTENKVFKSKKKTKAMLFYVAYGKGNHSTKDCRIMKNIQEKGMDKDKRVSCNKSSNKQGERLRRQH